MCIITLWSKLFEYKKYTASCLSWHMVWHVTDDAEWM